MGMNLGDRMKSHRLDNHQIRGSLAWRRNGNVGNIPEVIILSFLDYKGMWEGGNILSYLGDSVNVTLL